MNEHKTFKVISPIDGSIFLELPYADHRLIEKVLDKSTKAQASWKSTPLQKRRDICLRAIDLLTSQAQEIGEEITKQMGRPIAYSPYEILNGLKERATYMIDVAEQSLATTTIDNNRYIKKEALGTVLILAPWNYPFLTSINVIIPAIMAGNSVILKSAEQTPLTSQRYQAAFDQAGLPEGVFQSLNISHGQIADLVRDNRIQYVAFTGSVSGGAAVEKSIAQRFIGSGFELGGKDAAYVAEDADLKHTVENLVDGAFFNSGQSCCAIERIYVQENIYDQFLEQFISLTSAYKMGNPLDSSVQIGPMVSHAAAIRVQREIDIAIADGAISHINHNENNHQAYLYPEVLSKVDHRMNIMKKETFGPVVGIMKVKSEKEAVPLINDSEYGLTASIWTSNRMKAKEIGDQLQVGTVYMNRCDYLDPALAWTGLKNSGRGATLSVFGYGSLTRLKSYHMREL